MQTRMKEITISSNIVYVIKSLCHKKIFIWYPSVFYYKISKLIRTKRKKIIIIIGVYKTCASFLELSNRDGKANESDRKKLHPIILDHLE